jgi:small subunit ribosomal protein S8e
MSESHAKSKRTKTGAKLQSRRDKTKAELGREAKHVTLGETKSKTISARGNNTKQVLKSTNQVNVLDPKTGKTTKIKILTVLENNANRHYVRMNVLSKGAMIKTELGDAKITSRPGQHGIVNAVLV